MYSLLVFLHVLSALFLGSFLTFPFVMKKLYNRTGEALLSSINTIISFTRVGHYALILLFLTGVLMTAVFSVFPSILWVVISVLLLVVIGSLVGITLKELKLIYHFREPEARLLKRTARLTVYSWLMVLAIVTAVYIMTNRHLFS